MGWSIQQSRGLTHYRPDRTVAGYTLIFPLFGASVYLIDMRGAVVHQWKLGDQIANLARLLPNGRLATLGADRSIGDRPGGPEAQFLPIEQRVRAIGGNGSVLRELDWDGSVLWEYRNDLMHHDFVRLENGNTLIPEWVEVPEDVARQVKGAWRPPRVSRPKLLGDDIVEFDPDGREVQRLSTWQMFDPRQDPICPLEPYSEWTHLNSLDVNARGDIAFSCRQNSRVGIIDGQSGELTWKYGDPDTFHQHHATWQSGDTRLQIFDNGAHSHTQPASRVIEVDIATGEVTWQFKGSPALQFFSPHISSAQRLAGGNNLVCEGATGRIFEVTRSGEIVWEWLSPFFNEAPTKESVPWLYRAYRYLPDDPALEGRDLQPRAYASLNELHELG